MDFISLNSWRSRYYLTIWVLLCTCSMFAASSAEIPFELRNGLIIIEASIDDVSGNFILDTGSESILLNADDHSNHHEAQLSTLSGDVKATQVLIKKMTIGQVTLSNIPAYSTDLNLVEAGLHMEIAGLLGFHMLGAKFLEIDYSERLVKVHKEEPDIQESFLNQLKFDIVDDLPIVTIKFGDQTSSFLVDSGATIHFINESLVSSYQSMFSKTNTHSKVRTISSDDQIAEIVKASDEMPLFLVEKEFLIQDFSGIFLSDNTRIDGILSLSQLSDHIFFKIDSKRLLF